MAADHRGNRLAALRRRIETSGLDALLITHGPNIRYLTGFTGSAGLLVVTPGRVTLVTDFRYAEQAPAEAGDAVEIAVELSDLWSRVRRALEPSRGLRLGFEKDRLTVRDADRLARLEVDPVPTSEIVEGLRAVKDVDEVAAIRAAAALAHAALGDVLPTVKPGQSERLIAARLELALRTRGSEWHPFETIVASGPRSALPHARATDRAVGVGELLLIDFGARLDGYCADITRTVVVGGSADPKQREVHGIVAQAQQVAREGVRPEMSGREADALARNLIDGAGFGSAFGHSLGHGLGLEVHEGPRLSRSAEEPLPAGAVVTIEPGIYLEGWGGVRLEDDIHLTATGPVCLSDGRTELLEIH